MKTSIAILLLLIVNSCNNTKLIVDNLPGNYSVKGRDYSQNILINKNGTFSYTRKSLEVLSQCSGRWKYLGGDSVKISCIDTSSNPSKVIVNGNMGDYSERMIVLNKNKVKINNIILKRK